MTRLYDDPARFTEDMLSGFLDVHAATVVGVSGGVVRRRRTRPGKVAVVVGGGSGHYPAFCGVVGTGFADGAVVGNIFTSPSADDAFSVGFAAQRGAGLVFLTGNYAGDVMNFDQATARLEAEQVPTRTVYVTDDIASADPSEPARRRGIAGDFVVFKIAGAAAEEGYDLDGVERVARHANERTRTLGVAFSGCTMPGADTPLFFVPAGQMGVGLGIHGEPGVSEEELPRAAVLARRLVDGVVAELPSGTAKVGAILNGLGSTKYEELFVVWGTVARLLRERGLEVCEPEVGELVTSLDMAGCSLTLVALDEELERLWRAPADTPAYRKKSVAHEASGEPEETRSVTATATVELPPASAAATACAATAATALHAMRSALLEAEERLGRLDAVAGDGDHGRGMVKGIGAATDAADAAVKAGGGVGSVLHAAGLAWAGKAGGTSGALWGVALRAVGDHLGDKADSYPAVEVAAAVREGVDAVQALGKAAVGDKTMLDAMVPFVESLTASPTPDWAEAVRVAESAAEATAALTPRIGRARPLAERSLGSPDPGAVSFALCMRAVAGVVQP